MSQSSKWSPCVGNEVEDRRSCGRGWGTKGAFTGSHAPPASTTNDFAADAPRNLIAMPEHATPTPADDHHGASKLPDACVDAYNAELRDAEGFVGDRASNRAFRAILE